MTAPDDLRPRVDRLFEEVLDLEPDRRRARLRELARSDPEAHELLSDLLVLSEPRTTSRVDLSALASGPLLAELLRARDEEAAAWADLEIGAWRVVDELGRGGMGTVFLVERTGGDFEQRAALKLLHSRAPAEHLLKRFELERQILANLEHPNIARVLDGGATAEGQPYFVMEYVDGLPIDRYCDREEMGPEARLRLFLEVVEAVSHAHRNLVVHRDLKPSNILVGEAGAVKLLDFGIAKLLEEGSLEVTRTMGRFLTPEYASPEQVTGAPITVASDVYQLGLLLYRLLTAERAHRITSSVPSEIERVVCREPPKPPSRLLSELAGDPRAEEIASRRGLSPRGLVRALGGDLDTIVLKALHKEPARRYASTDRLAEDLRRHLRGDAVEARGDSLAYRARVFVKRHRFGVATAVMAFALLAAWGTSATLQNRTIRAERDRAQAAATRAESVKEFLKQLLEAADPEQARGRDLTARELLDRGWQRIQGGLDDQPAVRLELLNTMSEAYYQLGLWQDAEPLSEQALELARGLGPAGTSGLVDALAIAGDLDRGQGEYEAAEALLREGLAIAAADPTVTRDQRGRLRAILGKAVESRGDFEEAADLYAAALADRRAVFGPRHEEVADSLAALGLLAHSMSELERSEELLSRALDIRREVLPEDHPSLAANLSDLGLVVHKLGDLPSAEALFREALTAMVLVRGAEHPYVATVRNNLARVLRQAGDLEAAEQELRAALELRRRALGEGHLYVALTLNDLARAVQDQGRLDDALELYGRALELYPADHRWRAASVLNVGRVHQERGDLARAEQRYREALAAHEAHYGPRHLRVGSALNQIGVVRRLRGDLAGAESHLERALEILHQRLPEAHPQLVDCLLPLARTLVESGRPDEAQPLLREALAVLEASAPDDPRRVDIGRLLGDGRRTAAS